ncbi:hypothetical protein IT6_01085 [Methylacidiphilum caldifontis]|uniref:hypothetical protein n=1 Tax=Methylacidiphilum caldifontis TaxID=2795386 RepID=UPI001A8E1E70|nr:hypothetical protein [Methylacidiphilum caldifontis]QSR88932.1 hypothetical protein IT6_01085 [Methylacidiphilum caldifontis]
MAQNFPFRKPLPISPNEHKEKKHFPNPSGVAPHPSFPFSLKNHTPLTPESPSSSPLVHIHTPFIPKSSLHSPLVYPQSFSFPQQSHYSPLSGEPSDISKNDNKAHSSLKTGNFPFNPLSQQPFQKTNPTNPAFAFQMSGPQRKEEALSSFPTDTAYKRVQQSPPHFFSPSPPENKTNSPEISTNMINSPSASDSKKPQEDPTRHETNRVEAEKKKDKKQPSSHPSQQAHSNEKDTEPAEPTARSNRLLIGLTALVSLLTATYFVLAYYDIF